jgi:transcriptional regulator with XRE-family HTH domain
MDKNELLIKIRTRKLSALLYDVRTVNRRTPEECAQAINVAVEEYLSYENGGQAPSLPSLEMLAFYYKISPDYFSGSKTLHQPQVQQEPETLHRLRELRNRTIGIRLRQQRAQINLSTAALAEKTSIPEGKLAQYESGQVAIPMPELELIAATLGIPIAALYDQAGPIGSWRNEQTTLQQFTDLPLELKQFVCKPINRPYLEVALRLSELPVEKLRIVAESLLEITF